MGYPTSSTNPFISGAQKVLNKKKKVLNKSLLINYFTVESEIFCSIMKNDYEYNQYLFFEINNI